MDGDLAQARADFAALAQQGVDLDAVTAELQRDGVEKFAASFRDLMQGVERKLARVGQGG